MSADGSVAGGVAGGASGDEAIRYSFVTGSSLGLGDLPGGAFGSTTAAVSADGKVLVGNGQSASGHEAFRWTEATGMVGLGILPGGGIESWASDTSGDGRVVVGGSRTGTGTEAFIWSKPYGMRRLADVLTGCGLDLTGWTLTGASAVSDDGRTIVGQGRNPAGDEEGWIARLQTLPLGLGQATGCPGALVRIPLTARGFVGMGSLQLTIEWDPGVATYEGIEPGGLPDLSADNFGAVEPAKLTLSWDDATLAGTTLPDDSTLFAVQLRLTGPRGASCRVFVSNSPTAAEGATADYHQLEVTAADGQIGIINEVTISGTTSYFEAARPVSGVDLVLSGDEAQTVLTDTVGQYTLTVPGCGTYAVRAEKPSHAPANDGVTAADVLMIRRHVLGLEPLTSPYQLLAGDANGSRTITSMDIRLIRQLILDVRDTLPAGLWRFVRAGYVFPDPTAPWDAPDSRDYPDLIVSLSEQDYTGVKIGDANGSWTPPILLLAGRGGAGSVTLDGPAPPASFVVRPTSGVAEPGKQAEVSLQVEGAQALTTLQFTLAWDPGLLRFKSVGNYGLRGASEEHFALHRVGEGRLMFAWDDPQGVGISLPDGSGVFSAQFEVIGQVGEVARIRVDGSPTAKEATLGCRVVSMACRNSALLIASVDQPPKVQFASSPGGSMRLVLDGPPGTTWILEVSLDLVHWGPVPTLGALVVGNQPVSVDLPTSQDGFRFYRLALSEPGHTR